MGNRLILVAGSGRSGTSLFSGILKALGAHVPQPEVVADKTNPRGFGEPQWVADFHDALLEKANVRTADARPAAWSQTAEVAFDRDVESELQGWLKREFRNGDHLAIKDPRLLWFLPLWASVGRRVGVAVRFATVLRHPREVVKSKQTYYGESLHPTNRTAGWINTMLFTERAMRNEDRIFVRYEDLLSDWTQALARVCETLDLDLLDRVKTSDMRQVSQLVDPSQKRSTTEWKTLGVHREIADMAEEVWELLDEVATKDVADDPSTIAAFDGMRRRYLDFYDMVEATAQSSVLASGRGHVEQVRASAGSRSQQSGAQATAKQMALKGKRKVKRAVRGMRNKVGGSSPR